MAGSDSGAAVGEPPLFVDDYLALAALQRKAPSAWGDRVPGIPWVCHLRLIQAITRSRVQGRLTRMASRLRLEDALHPPPDLLVVIDTRPCVDTIARYIGQRGISIMAAEMLGAAVHVGAEIHAAARNVNDHWATHVADTSTRIVRYHDRQLDIPHRVPQRP